MKKKKNTISGRERYFSCLPIFFLLDSMAILLKLALNSYLNAKATSRLDGKLNYRHFGECSTLSETIAECDLVLQNDLGCGR